MCEPKEKVMTREEIESQYYQYTSAEKAIVALLIEISDKLKTEEHDHKNKQRIKLWAIDRPKT